jgi:hypothetical protein
MSSLIHFQIGQPLGMLLLLGNVENHLSIQSTGWILSSRRRLLDRCLLLLGV